jgi:hypothetical protein
MKKMILTMAVAAVALTSCKKDPVETIELGTATINGTVVADIDQTNDVNQAGIYQNGLNLEGVDGMTVRAFVWTGNYTQSPDMSYPYDTEVYTATTGADGTFSIQIPATQQGFNVTLEFEDKYGVTKTLYSSSGNSATEESYISKGDEQVFIYDGGSIDVWYQAAIDPVNNNANEYGTATVSGTVYCPYDLGLSSTGNILDYPLNASSPFPGKEVVLTWDYAPYGQNISTQLKVVIDANGDYTMTVPTEVGGGAVDFYIGMMSFTGDLIRPNHDNSADSTWQGNYFLPGNYEHILQSAGEGDIIPGVDLVLNVTPLF